jgi:crotonobetainyl-CoA:carnitine CoA-transferase CaiB-like acyl-CoA transferase
LFRELVRGADAVVENFSPHVVHQLGADYETLRAIKPDLIMLSISAYGATGPWRDLPGNGGTTEAVSGLSSLLGYEGGPPLNSGQMFPDPVAGLFGVGTLLAALYARRRLGAGQFIDLSMQQANSLLLGDALIDYGSRGVIRPRMGNKHPVFAPHGIFPCSDGRWLALAAETDEQWQAFAALVGGGLPGNPDFATRDARKSNEAGLDLEITQWTQSHDRDFLLAKLRLTKVIFAPVLDEQEVAVDQVFRSRGVVQEVTHQEAGTHPQAIMPWRFSRSEPPSVRPAPLMSEHSWEILHGELGVDAEEFNELVNASVTGAGPPL